MTPEPLVACIILTRDRPEMAKRAVECFRSQTYHEALLFILDTGHSKWYDPEPDIHEGAEAYFHRPVLAGQSIGFLRNWMIGQIDPSVGLVAHLDDDDWSHPDRLAEQVELLQSSGKLVTGYRDMLFWDAVTKEALWYDSRRNYALGTSLCYRREAWERTPFPDQTPEDSTWLNQVGESNLVTVSSIGRLRAITTDDGSGRPNPGIWSMRPMMIQTLHGGNAAAHKSRAAFEPATVQQDQEVRRILDA